MDPIRARIVRDVERTTGTHDDPDVYGGPPGDPGLIGPDSVSWEIHSDPAAVAQAGIPAIVLEILHPSVMAGVSDHSNYRDDPFSRARTTLGYVLTTTFGNTDAARTTIDRVAHIHGFVTGTRPDGVPYRALDPELIAWVHTAIPWMIMRAFEATNRVLSADERDRYLAEQSIIGTLAGAEHVPTGVAELEEFVAQMRPKLAVNAQTREFVDFLLSAPFVPDLPPVLDREMHRFALYAGMSRAPRWAAELIGFDRPSPAVRAMIGPFLQLDARTMRWAFGTPAYARLARQRAAGVRRGAARVPR